MSKKDKPTKSISKLPEKTRKFMRALIREICINNELYSQAHKHGIGLEETEEAFESLLNTGDLKIFYNEENDTLLVKKWNEKYKTYI